MAIFTAVIDNQPGQLALVLETLANARVNAMLAGIADGDSGAVVFTVDDEAAARSALTNAAIAVRESPALQVRLENSPGTAAVLARRLAKVGVNIKAFLPIAISASEAIAVIAVDDVDKARHALGNQLIT